MGVAAVLVVPAAAAAGSGLPPLSRTILAALSVGAVYLVAAAARRREVRLLEDTGRAAVQFTLGHSEVRDPEQRLQVEVERVPALLFEAARAVADREAEFARLARATGDAVWDWNLRTGMVSCTHGGRAVLGTASDAFTQPIGWWQQRVHPEDRERVDDAVARVRNGADPTYSVEFRFHHADRRFKWVWDRGAVVRDITGDAVRIVGCTTDISARKAAEEDLEQAERRQRALITAVSSIVWRDVLGSPVQPRNPAWEEYTGQTQEQEFGKGWLDAVHPEDREGMLRAWSTAMQDGSIYQANVRLRRHDGVYRWMAARGAPVRDRSGNIVEYIGLYEDIEDHYAAREELRRRTDELGERVKELRCLHAVAMACNQDSKPVGEVLSGIALVLGSAMLRPEMAICSIEWAGETFQSPIEVRPGVQIEAALTVDGTAPGRIVLGYSGRAENIAVLPEEEQVLNTAATLVRQMLSRRQDREQLEELANADALTGLPNRRSFGEKLESALSKGEKAVALLLIDLDHFKDVNDTLGHDAGDALLCAVAQRLRGATRSEKTIARLGGDEFGVVVSGRDVADARAQAIELLDALRQPVVLAGRTTTIRFSAGLAVAPDDGSSGAELLKNADIALYFGKSRGRNAFVSYEPQMRQETERRIAVCADVRTGLEANQFVPFYQPKVSLRTGEVTGFEALLRWNHPDGWRSPGVFLPALEAHDIALAFGKLMLDRIIEDMQVWRGDGLPYRHVALNVSGAEFAAPNLAETLLDRLAAAELPASSLGIEVTETVLLGRDADTILPSLTRLHRAGVSIALDDFGTGFASLTHLQQYPVDVIKIDQSFVRGIDKDAGSQAITAAVLGLGSSLGITVIAEGVETEQQAMLLRGAGCQEAQGFFFAHPMPAAEVPGFLRDWSGRRGEDRGHRMTAA